AAPPNPRSSAFYCFLHRRANAAPLATADTLSFAYQCASGTGWLGRSGEGGGGGARVGVVRSIGPGGTAAGWGTGAARLRNGMRHSFPSEPLVPVPVRLRARSTISLVTAFLPVTASPSATIL